MDAGQNPSAQVEAFVKTVLQNAEATVGEKIEKERKSNGFSIETYYKVRIPYAPETPEFNAINDIVGQGSMKNPHYIQLFEALVNGMSGWLDAQGVRSFVTLNCRFNDELDDNLLLYVFASW